MLEIKTLDDIRGNNVVIYSIKKLLEKKSFPKLSIMAGVMGVGKTSVAKVVAQELDKSGNPIQVYNFGMPIDLNKIQEEVFSLNPMKPRAFIFEELHGLNKGDQNALLQMFDSQSPNIYVICTTTEIYNIIRTIRSRAQVWEFKSLSNKQCAQLLEDYLADKGVRLSEQAKQSLLRSCRGIPRDLLKNTDFAIEGEFTPSQLDTLLGNVSDDLIFALFCSLKSKTTDFIANIETFMEDGSSTKLSALQDFWLRYILERNGGTKLTLSSQMIDTLNAVFSDEDIMKVSKTLLRAERDTIMLELVTLNMSLTQTSSATVLGYQRDAAMQAEREKRIEKQQGQTSTTSVKVTSSAVKEFHL